ncbi:MAG: SDR family NAD(P)-dependent oxidoreductase, partial [Rhodospirillaceae bacterium]
MAKNAWITGAGKGIGRATAKRLADAGWRVAVSARTTTDLISLKSEVTEGA